jgi:exocyst complex component 4
MLRSSPFHRENYSRLILGVVIQFYQRCSDRFQALTTTPAVDGDQEAQVALAAQWAQRLELQTCLMELMSMKVERFFYQWLSSDMISQEPNDLRQQELYRQETQIEMDFLEQKKISKADLISSVRDIAALASLHRSVVRSLFAAFAVTLMLLQSWFAAELNALKARPQDTLSNMTPINLEPVTGFTPSTSYMPSLPPESLLEPLSLPLSREMAL